MSKIYVMTKFDDLYHDIAERVARLSRAQRLQVGAVIVKDHRILSYGYNGTPPGFDNACEFEIPEEVDLVSRTITPARLVTKPMVIHAEMNAIAKVARSHDSCLGASLYITHAPCIECSKAILQAGISAVHYGTEYRSAEGILLLTSAGVTCIKKPYESTT